MQLAGSIVAAVLLGALSPAWADESPVPGAGAGVLQAIRAAPTCHEAASIAKEALSGTEADLVLNAAVTGLCERDFLPGLDARRRAEYEGWRASCNRRPAAEAGSFDRSVAAYCAADVSERYSAQAIAAKSPAGHAAWSRYVNVRFEYGVDIPPGFTPVSEAANGDGGTSGSVSGHADLAVWGANLLGSTLTADARARIDSAAGEGWVVGYKALTARVGSWSARRGDRIQYTRTVAQCGDRIAALSIEYDADAKIPFDPIVTRLARGLRGLRECGRRKRT